MIKYKFQTISHNIGIVLEIISVCESLGYDKGLIGDINHFNYFYLTESGMICLSNDSYIFADDDSCHVTYSHIRELYRNKLQNK